MNWIYKENGTKQYNGLTVNSQVFKNHVKKEEKKF